MPYTEIRQKEFEEILSSRGYKWEIVPNKFAKETIYMVGNGGNDVSVLVYSSLVGGVSREVGADAIRVVGWDPVSNLPVMKSEARVNRTEGWRENLIKRIEDVREKMKDVQKCTICGGILVERENKTTHDKFMGCLNWKNHSKMKGEDKTKGSDDKNDKNRGVLSMETGERTSEGKSVTPDILPDKSVDRDNVGRREEEEGKREIGREKIGREIGKIINYDGLKFYEVAGDEPLLETTSFKWGKFGFDKFNPIQSKVAEVVGFDNNVVVEAKTSTGKTQMGEMFMWYVLGQGKKIIYTSPLKALTREKWDSWMEKFGGAGYKIAIVTGDYRLTDKRIAELNEADIILCTSEMLDHRTRNMSSEKSDWLRKAGLLILDEVQMIGMKERGDKLEAGLMRFTLINPECRLILLSGTMPNSGEIAKWVGSLNRKETVLIKSGWRPIRLNMEYIQYADNEGYYEAKSNMFNIIKGEVKKHDKDKILIFVHSKTDGRAIMKMLEDMGYAVEFHNADLNNDERIEIEKGFKDKGNDGIRIMIATSTLAYGLNLPARIVLIAGMHRGIEEVSELDIIQMCGRSGRMGIDTEGTAIMIFPERRMDEFKFKIEHPGDIKSQIDNPLIMGFHIIGEIVGKTVKTRNDVHKWYSRTLAIRQNIMGDMGAGNEEEYVNELVDYLIENKAIREINGKLEETELGRAAVFFYLRPDMIKDLLDTFDKIFEIGVEANDFIFTVGVSKLRMYENVIVSKSDRAEIEIYNKAVKGLKNTLGEISEGQAKVGMAYLNMLRGVGGTIIVEEDGKKTKVGNPLISLQRGLQQDVERLFGALAYIDAKYARWGKGTYWSSMSIRLKYGVGPELISLCSLNGVGGTFARKLYDAGIRNPTELVTKRKEAIMALGSRYAGIIEKNRRYFDIVGVPIPNQVDIDKAVKDIEKEGVKAATVAKEKTLMAGMTTEKEKIEKEKNELGLKLLGDDE